MTKSFILLACLFLRFAGISQPCLPDGVTFSTQSQIDSFPISHPGCTGIEGNVSINGTSITNLAGLNALTSVGGWLVVLQCDSLTSLNGLGYLESVGTEMVLLDNPLLSSLAGLGRLKSVGTNLSIQLEKQLTDLTGLDSLQDVGGWLRINSDSALTSLKGLGSLVSVGTDVGLWDNPVLTDLTALEKLGSVGGELYLSNNTALTTLSGLDHIDAGSITSLHIVNNTHLKVCAVQSICQFLDIPFMLVDFTGNATGCSSEEEVKAACDTLSVGPFPVPDRVTVCPNPASTRITIEIAGSSPSARVRILDLGGQELLNCPFTGRTCELNIGGLAKGIYLVQVTTPTYSKLLKFTRN
jgi:hypothetical protein